MRRRIKIKDSVREESSLLRMKQLKHKSHLLHSDKNIYFYNNKLGFGSACLVNCVSPSSPSHETRRSSGPSLRAEAASPSLRCAADGFLGKVKLGLAGLSNVPLLLSSLVLLMMLGGLIFPGVPSGAYAEGGDEVEAGVEALAEGDPAIALSLADIANSGTMSGTGDEKMIQEQVGSSNVGHISVDFNVKASNIEKYDIYVQSSSKELVGEANGERIGSINTDTTYANMKNNTGWGYAVEKNSNVNPEGMTYRPIQTTVNTPVDSGSATGTSIDQTYTLAFAANLTGATADHYKTNVILSVAAGATQVATLYSVTYNTNNSTGGITPATQTAESNSETYTFVAPTADQYGLAKTDYILGGWAESPNDTFPQYVPGSTITLAKDKSSISLYAIWYKNKENISDWSDLYVMQQMTSSICDKGIESGKQLMDIRDGKLYWVAKLNDGHCWMTQNLDLDITPKGLKAVDTDISSDWMPEEEETTIMTDLSAEAWPEGSNIIRSWDPALGGKATYCNNGTIAGGCKQTGNPTTSVNNGHDAQGNYYSWCAATAGCQKVPSNNADMSSSICPKGWRLPSDNNSITKPKGPTYTDLKTAYNIGDTGSKLLDSPLYFVYGGSVSGGSLNKPGTSGRYWSSTVKDTSNIYSLIFYATVANASDNVSRHSGISVRCVAR